MYGYLRKKHWICNNIAVEMFCVTGWEADGRKEAFGILH
jgi:hypothetical protein